MYRVVDNAKAFVTSVEVVSSLGGGRAKILEVRLKNKLTNGLNSA